jgi:hypothetical protein
MRRIFLLFWTLAKARMLLRFTDGTLKNVESLAAAGASFHKTPRYFQYQYLFFIVPCPESGKTTAYGRLGPWAQTSAHTARIQPLTSPE